MSELSFLEDQIESTILQSRRLFFAESVDSTSAKEMIRKLWYLDLQHPKKPILFIINSPGGSIDAGFAIWDQAKMLSCPLYTLITGMAASMGSILALCAPKEHRFATPLAQIMIHQPSISGIVRGQASDLDIHAQKIIKTREFLVDLYSQETGQPKEIIDKKLDRDTWMSAQEAKEFGLIHDILTSYSAIPM